jgi:hypothetical protein
MAKGRCLCGALTYELDGPVQRDDPLPLLDVPQASRHRLRHLRRRADRRLRKRRRARSTSGVTITSSWARTIPTTWAKWIQSD